MSASPWRRALWSQDSSKQYERTKTKMRYLAVFSLVLLMILTLVGAQQLGKSFSFKVSIKLRWWPTSYLGGQGGALRRNSDRRMLFRPNSNNIRRQASDKGSPSKECLVMCSRQFEPVCGSDGKTYANDCLLKVAACKAAADKKISVIKLASKGECAEGSWMLLHAFVQNYMFHTLFCGQNRLEAKEGISQALPSNSQIDWTDSKK